jgi:hypothetical protein
MPGSQDAGSGAWFSDVTEQAGIRFQHDAGALPTPSRYFMPQSIGSGAALIDYDQMAGWIFICCRMAPDPRTNRLFHQGTPADSLMPHRTGLTSQRALGCAWRPAM